MGNFLLQKHFIIQMLPQPFTEQRCNISNTSFYFVYSACEHGKCLFLSHFFTKHYFQSILHIYVGISEIK